MLLLAGCIYCSAALTPGFTLVRRAIILLAPGIASGPHCIRPDLHLVYLIQRKKKSYWLSDMESKTWSRGQLPPLMSWRLTNYWQGGNDWKARSNDINHVWLPF